MRSRKFKILIALVLPLLILLILAFWKNGFKISADRIASQLPIPQRLVLRDEPATAGKALYWEFPWITDTSYTVINRFEITYRAASRTDTWNVPLSGFNNRPTSGIIPERQTLTYPLGSEAFPDGCFTVRAIRENPFTRSRPSNEVCIQQGQTGPNQPLIPPRAVSAIPEDATHIRLEWDDLNSNEGGYNIYQVYFSRRTSTPFGYIGAPIHTVIPSTGRMSTIISNRQPGFDYCFQIEAYRGSEKSSRFPDADRPNESGNLCARTEAGGGQQSGQNQAPIVSRVSTTTTTEGFLGRIDIRATDPNGDSDMKSVLVKWRKYENNAWGSWNNLTSKDWSRVANGQDVILWTPRTSGLYTLAAVVTDQGGREGRAEQNVTILAATNATPSGSGGIRLYELVNKTGKNYFVTRAICDTRTPPFPDSNNVKIINMSSIETDRTITVYSNSHLAESFAARLVTKRKTLTPGTYPDLSIINFDNSNTPLKNNIKSIRISPNDTCNI